MPDQSFKPKIPLSQLSYTIITMLILSCTPQQRPAMNHFAHSSPPQSRAAFYIGHSLVSFDKELAELSQSAGVELKFNKQTIGGASLKENWQTPERSDSQNFLKDFPTSSYDTLVLTEKVLPLEKTMLEEDSKGYALEFAKAARKHNPQVQIYIYETWHSLAYKKKWYEFWKIDWREKIDQDLPRWLEIIEHVNQNSPAEVPKVLMVPAGQAMALAFDQIKAQKAPGLKHIQDLFEDDIHLNSWGKYFVACVQFATLYQISPIGLTTMGLPPEVAQTLQEIAWQSVSSKAGAPTS